MDAKDREILARIAYALETIAEKGITVHISEEEGSGYYKRNGDEITELEIIKKMSFLQGTGEYDGFSEKELFKIAVEMIQDGE